jgi:hypothetical protein
VEPGSRGVAHQYPHFPRQRGRGTGYPYRNRPDVALGCDLWVMISLETRAPKGSPPRVRRAARVSPHVALAPFPCDNGRMNVMASGVN